MNSLSKIIVHCAVYKYFYYTMNFFVKFYMKLNMSGKDFQVGFSPIFSLVTIVSRINNNY